jgi:DNA-binding transcriptional regulator YiaG
MAKKTDRDVLAEAIKATELSARAFARVIGANERTVRRWLEGEPMSSTARQLCRLLAIAPHLALELGEE